MKYKYIFIVLVYRNTIVLKDFFKSFKIKNSKVVVVNSYYDDKSKEIFEKIALENNADFINIENKGYSYGNNVGIQYALKRYEFEYIVISNSDTTIIEFDDLTTSYKGTVIAPQVTNIKGKKQNPNLCGRYNLYFLLLNLGYKHNLKFCVTIAHAVSRITRELFHFYLKIFNKTEDLIYSPHGSFIIIGIDALFKILPVFNDKMFLYLEEIYIAENCLRNDVPIYYNDKIKILHIDGGSSNNDNTKSYQLTKESYNKLSEYIS